MRNNSVAATKIRLYGNYNGNVEIHNRDNVTVNVDVRGDEYTQIAAISSLNVFNSGARITAVADNNGGSYNCYAISNLNSLLLTEGGIADFTGNVYSASLPSGQSPHTVTTTPANNNYFWKDIDEHYYYEDFLLCDLSGEPLERAVFEYSAELAELKWVGDELIYIPSGSVGDYFGLNLWAGIRGSHSFDISSSSWRFEILEGSFPEGFGYAYPWYNGKMGNQIIAPCNAGTVKIKATDYGTTSGDEDDRSIIFEVSYGAFTTNNPVTGITVDQDSIVLEHNGEGEITATVTPSNAAYPYVTGSISASGNGYVYVYCFV